MERNNLDADNDRLPVVHCTLGLCGRDSGICKTCKRPSAVLIGEHCPECMTPCDLRADGSCPMPDMEDDKD
ncbi:MAG: hypothetical protein SGJ27_09490 [Candidatus Melainabacteria bacterium]|nr:hypothetical protein [Candidatus Melainabacteria bacterium]